MAAARVFADRDGLAPVVLAAFGQGRPLTGVQRLRDASKKGVYRLGLGGGGSVIAYVWDAAENYWAPGPAESPGSAEPTGPAERPAGPGSTDVFADASGPDLFSTAHALLDGLGVRTPAVYLLDRSRSRYPAGIALVEDIPGETLEARLELGRPGAEAVTARLGEVLRRMHQHRGEQLGRPGAGVPGQSCEQVVLDRALRDLGQSADRDGRIAAARGALERALRDLAAAVPPRQEYA